MSRKALALVSGGLDSMLAIKVVQEEGVEVEGINFQTGFGIEAHKRNNTLWVVEQLGIKLHRVDVSTAYKDVLLNPEYGYGANLNPCLDCKIFMVNTALKWIKQHNFDFIITGEVVGQRPMSQRKDTMPVIATKSGAHDLLLRPLSAKNLPPSKAECEGWVKRENMYNFSGRNRKPQMALAQKFNITDYATPAGGCCFLTDKNYSARLRDLWQQRGHRDYDMQDITLLKVGRHIRPNERFKLIVSRDESETNFLYGLRENFIFLELAETPGPIALLDGVPNEQDIELAAAIVARYSKARFDAKVKVNINGPELSCLEVAPLAPTELKQSWQI